MIINLEKLRPNFLAHELRKIIPLNCKTILDVGCGENSIVRNFKNKSIKKIGVEIFPEAIKKSKMKNIHDEYFCEDARNIGKLFASKSVDCIMSIDVIEHLEREDALELIKKMENLSKKIVVIQTTNGFFPQNEVGGNYHQLHRCGFSSDELTILGYTVLGMDGPKFLRKKTFESRNPNIIVSIAANILDPIFRFFPKKSFNLLAYKLLHEKN